MGFSVIAGLAWAQELAKVAQAFFEVFDFWRFPGCINHKPFLSQMVGMALHTAGIIGHQPAILVDYPPVGNVFV